MIAVVAILVAVSDSRARSQPSVIVEFAPAVDSDTTVDLVVRNTGPTPARNLTVSFDPPLSAPANPHLVTPILIRRYSKQIPTLSPDQQLRNIWWAGRQRSGAAGLENAEPTPDAVTVRVAYDGLGWRKRRETFRLDVDTVKATTYSVSSASVRGRMKTIDASLKKLAAAVEGMRRDQRPEGGGARASLLRMFGRD